MPDLFVNLTVKDRYRIKKILDEYWYCRYKSMNDVFDDDSRNVKRLSDKLFRRKV